MSALWGSSPQTSMIDRMLVAIVAIFNLPKCTVYAVVPIRIKHWAFCHSVDTSKLTIPFSV